MRNVMIFILLLAFATACKLKPSDESNTKTDLGLGNDEVVARYKAYSAAHPSGACVASGSGTRVIVTGFNLFQGATFNISGTVAMSMADTNFWPEEVSLDAKPPENIKSFSGLTKESENGGRAVARSLKIDGQQYEVCFMLLDVQWDLAAALIMYEAAKFQPEMIIMSGLNPNDKSGITFELGAINKATQYGGFGSSGAYSRVNMPSKNNAKIIPDGESSIWMTWDAKMLESATTTLVTEINSKFHAKAATNARGSNDYICNNVSYVVLAGHQRRVSRLLLAGGKLKILRRKQRAKIGFIHFPGGASADGKEVFGWAKVIAKAITASVAGLKSSDSSEGEPADKKVCTKCFRSRRYCGSYNFETKKWKPGGAWEDCGDQKIQDI